MSKLQLSIAMGDYDRTRALIDGRVQIDGVDPEGRWLIVGAQDGAGRGLSVTHENSLASDALF